MPIEIPFANKELERYAERIKGSLPVAHFKLKSLDALTGGVRRGKIVIIGGSPGAGKTTLMSQLVDDLSAEGCICVVSTIDVEAYNWVQKSISRCSGGAIPVGEIPYRFDEPTVQSALKAYEDTCARNIIFLEKPMTSVELGHVIGAIQSERPEQQVILWVDYLQIMKPEPKAGALEERLAVKQAVMGLRDIAKTYNIPVFSISTLNRSSYAKTAGLDGLGASSQIEYDADQVLVLNVEGKGDERLRNMNAALRPVAVTSLKSRYAPCGETRLSFDATHATFVEDGL